MGCLTCGSDTTSGGLLCSVECGHLAEQELDRNRTRLGELRQRRAGPPCAESRGLIDRNSQLHDALVHLQQAVAV